MSAAKAARLRVVVDGSNLATEGRTMPSLQQLDEAVSAYIEERPDAEVIVVVDASFDHRIPASERAKFKDAELAGEIVTTPAGAIGRGDAFILKIAARINAVVLSNDSFQEFHDEHPWLFDVGRLVGGKPVPGVGWVFADRQPVRGAKAVRAAKKLKMDLPGGVKPTVGATITPVKAKAAKVDHVADKAPAKKVSKSAKTTKAPAKKVAKAPEKPPVKKAVAKTAAPEIKKATKAKVEKAPAKRPAKVSTESSEKSEPAVALRRRRQAVNPESAFSEFIQRHKPKSIVEGEVVAFTSHGAVIVVTVGSERVECYAPTTSLGNPPPARARDVLKRGDKRSFRLSSVDKERRIAEVALP